MLQGEHGQNTEGSQEKGCLNLPSKARGDLPEEVAFQRPQDMPGLCQADEQRKGVPGRGNHKHWTRRWDYIWCIQIMAKRPLKLKPYHQLGKRRPEVRGVAGVRLCRT